MVAAWGHPSALGTIAAALQAQGQGGLWVGRDAVHPGFGFWGARQLHSSCMCRAFCSQL